MVTLSEKYGRKPRNENIIGTKFPADQEKGESLNHMQVLDGIAQQITRGVSRYFRALNKAVLTEMPLADGRRCDIMALGEKGDIIIVEIKSCVADFRSDGKWPDYRQWCDRFYFAVLQDFPQRLIPEDCGLILADRFGADCVREAPEQRLSAARRKALTLRFARGSAFRLQDAGDREVYPVFSW